MKCAGNRCETARFTVRNTIASEGPVESDHRLRGAGVEAYSSSTVTCT